MLKQYGIIGHPVAHIMSPFIHTRLMTLATIEGQYTVTEVLPERLAQAMTELSSFDGYNVTLPYKQEIIPFLDSLSHEAELYGAVNTVYKGKGYNTDSTGFIKTIEHNNMSLDGKVLIIGAGGASSMFAAEAAMYGSDVTVAVRSQSVDKAMSLADDIRVKLNIPDVKVCAMEELDVDFDLLINGTPVGMHPYPDSCPVSDSVISRCKAVLDAVYNPSKTLLLKKAEAMDKRSVGGMPMLVWQAAASQEIWNDVSFSVDVIEKIIQETKVEQFKRFGY